MNKIHSPSDGEVVEDIDPFERLMELQKDLLDLDINEQLEKIKRIREDRRLTKAPPKIIRKKQSNEDKFKKELAKLSPAEQKTFLMELLKR